MRFRKAFEKQRLESGGGAVGRERTLGTHAHQPGVCRQPPTSVLSTTSPMPLTTQIIIVWEVGPEEDGGGCRERESKRKMKT